MLLVRAQKAGQGSGQLLTLSWQEPSGQVYLHCAPHPELAVQPLPGQQISLLPHELPQLRHKEARSEQFAFGGGIPASSENCIANMPTV